MTGSADQRPQPATAPDAAVDTAASTVFSTGSRFFQRLERRYAAQLALLPEGPPSHASLATAWDALRSDGAAPGEALRMLRQLSLHRLIQLDCDRQASLGTVTRSMTELAEFALDHACSQAFADLDARHGQPLATSGERAQLWVIGMGKLGARELNVSSDIDLIYVYDEDGDTTGRDDGRDEVGEIPRQRHDSRRERTTRGGAVRNLSRILRHERVTCSV